MTAFLHSIHPIALVALLALMLGGSLGVALALSEWRSRLGISTLVSSTLGTTASLTAPKIAVLRDIFATLSLVTPILVVFTALFLSFWAMLLVGGATVFVSNALRGSRAKDPNAIAAAGKKAVTLFGNGILHYATNNPERAAEARLAEFKIRNTVLWLLQKTLVGEVARSRHSPSHFVDTVAALGHTMLQYCFGDDADLKHFRMAFFKLEADRLEYCVTVNNGDTTSHSGRGFVAADSFMGEALNCRQPLIYPKHRKWRGRYVKRKQARYKSFIAIPIPCDHAAGDLVGVLTVDSTEKHNVFTASRVESLVAFSQLIFALYVLNMQGELHASS